MSGFRFMATIKLIQMRDNYHFSIIAPSENAGIELTPADVDLLYNELAKVYVRESDGFEVITEDQE